MSHRFDNWEGDINAGHARERWIERFAGDEAAEWLTRDEAAFFRQSLSTPCLQALGSASGSWIEDVDRRRYLDFHGNSAHHLGHGHPAVIEATIQALRELPFCPRRFTNRWAVEFAEALLGLVPIADAKVLFAPGGAEAMSMALKLVRRVTGRHKTISFWGSFHGATLDTIAIGGERLFRSGIGALAPGAHLVPAPAGDGCVFGCQGNCTLRCADYLERVLELEGDIGAVIAEPLRCTTVEIPPLEYWARIRSACDRHGALLIFDEIPIALGRTGRWFASEHWDVVPDILVLGKALGGGIWPMAAMVARGEFDVNADVALGHFTHEKSSVGCAAGLAALRVMAEGRLVERSAELGAAWRRDLASRVGSSHQVRGLGLLTGIVMNSEESAERTLYACLERGLSFKVSGGRVLTLTPPLTVSQEELLMASEIISDAINGA